ncbi:hypothetical protein [Tropicimonas sp. IMCC34043]|uniref:hypothetical protein n=1 Tax=Tropicimonas sp. IMCC34043 TaxID=2248760 RepID=UPI000E250F17|nr:hypothetical protein [Tropicimonas sp. IMCC34043]
MTCTPTTRPAIFSAKPAAIALFAALLAAPALQADPMTSGPAVTGDTIIVLESATEGTALASARIVTETEFTCRPRSGSCRRVGHRAAVVAEATPTAAPSVYPACRTRSGSCTRNRALEETSVLAGPTVEPVKASTTCRRRGGGCAHSQ